MKNVLIPDDFSDISLKAIEYTEDFFKNTAVKFYLLRDIYNYNIVLV
jgi:hypothetical protein